MFATQCLLQRRPRTMTVDVTGHLGPGITAKDLALAIIARIGVNGGTGHVIEYLGSGIEALSMDERMTVCNMSIEAGARAGMVAVDETTIQYLQGRPRAPAGDDWERAVADWRTLRSDPGAHFDRRVSHAADAVEPMITYGTHPGMVVPIGGCVPDRPGDAAHAKSLTYMGLQPGDACGTSRSRPYSSAAAPMRGCRTSSSRPRCSPAAASRPASACSSFRARRA